jgi:hypothetical protein
MALQRSAIRNWTVAGVLTVAGVSAGEGATVTVCPSGCDATTIQGAATAANPGDTIQILSTLEHTEGDIFLNKNLAIEGFGATLTIIQADPVEDAATVPVFVITSGASVTMRDLTIRHGGGLEGAGVRVLDGDLDLMDVRLRNNLAGARGGGIFVATNSTLKGVRCDIRSNTANGGSGGGIHADGAVELVDTTVSSNLTYESLSDAKGGGVTALGSLILRRCTVQNNHAWTSDTDDFATGGGVYFGGTSLLIEDSSILYNTATGDPSSGGGLEIRGSAPAVVRRTSFTGNDSDDGGAIYSSLPGLEIDGCTVADNAADYIGGGLVLYASALISNSTITGNTASYGGAIYAWVITGTVSIVNSTISGNAALVDGGGVYVEGGAVELASTTITDNSADDDTNNSGDGGGIYVAGSATVGMRNTLIAANRDRSPFLPFVAHDCRGTLQSSGYNLVRSLGLTQQFCTISGDPTGNLTSVDPMLDVLADNGGPTETHAIDASSPAVNAGNPAGCTDQDGVILPADQRGGVRTNRCDIGAYEFGALVGLIFSDGFETGTTAAWSAAVP